MLNGKTFLAIIPARGGSKRLPRKNVLDLAGKPLIAWTIEAALKSNYIDKVIVSSDDDEILTISEKYGAMSLKRPDILATDTATSFDVIKHAIENNERFDFIVLLQATSPLRNAAHIDEAVMLLRDKHADAIVSLCELEHSSSWTNTLPRDENMSNFLSSELLNKRSQDLEVHYRLNGAIYIANTYSLLIEKTFFLKENVFAYKMDRNSSVDIDEDFDLKFASFIMSKETKGKI